ncbi:hypothetical protein [Methylobacterium sp. J-070]|uniref:hypothetical protein n=1 Tax=Methylobacterium sp. J-070 TaxID=2836650 RepID=UPI001FBABD27|nr:hypothetical protein [Methylobacterium sp. J-070]MCJ2053971.1 hypothetical protein [Methylobacterium sp. J-070]
MFDFSWTGILMAFASMLLAAVSPVTLKFLGAALVILVGGRIVLPPHKRGVALTAAAGIMAFAFCWQAAVTEGARRMLVHDHAVALQAERERAELAETLTHELAEQATKDLAAEQADHAKLKDITDALARDPRRDGVCVPRDLSRRLRQL